MPGKPVSWTRAQRQRQRRGKPPLTVQKVWTLSSSLCSSCSNTGSPAFSPSLSEVDTLPPNFPLQFQWRAEFKGWVSVKLTLFYQAFPFSFKEGLTDCGHSVLSGKGTPCCQNFSSAKGRVSMKLTLCDQTLPCSFSEGLTDYRHNVLSEKRTPCCQSFSSVKGWLTLLTQCSFGEIDKTFAIQWRIDQLCCHNFSQQCRERVNWVAVNILLCQLRKGSTLCYQTARHGVTLYCHSLSVKGWLLFQWRVDCSFSEGLTDTLSIFLQQCRVHTLLSYSFSEGMTFCCQTLSVKGWHFAVRPFRWRDDTLLSDSFGEGMTFCCQTLSVKGWHFAVNFFLPVTSQLTSCCPTFCSTEESVDTLLSNSLSLKLDWHSLSVKSRLTLCCQTFSFKEGLTGSLMWFSSLSVKGSHYCQIYSLSEWLTGT